MLAHLVGPEAVQNGEIFSAANDREQAAQVFMMARQMVEADAELSGMVKAVPSTKTLACYGNGSFFRALSAEAGTKHGKNPTVVIYDELAQAKSRELYDVLDTAMGARQEPLFIVISTQSPDPQHILSQLIDDGLSGRDPTTVCHLYEVTDEADVFDAREWKKANPALGDFRSLEDFKVQAARAKRMPSFESTFRNLYCNQRVDASAPLVSRTEWVACRADWPLIKDGERVFLGLDLSSTTDLTALAILSADDGDRVAAQFWKPGDLVEEHTRRDRADYKTWAAQGWIDTPPGRAINYDFVAERLAELHIRYRISGLAFDRWRIEQLKQRLDAVGLECWVDGKDEPVEGALRMVPWGQGFKDMAPAIDALEIAVTERTFQHDGNPVLTMCFANAMPVQDAAGNRKLDKSKSRLRIDGAVAVVMAKGLKAANTEAEAGPSIYETRGLLMV